MKLKTYYKIAEKRLFKLNRSITGNGTLQTLKIIKKQFKKFQIKKIKSGTTVFDWKIPSEWNVKEAYVVDCNNVKIIDFKFNNLHLIGYSINKNIKVKKKELLKRLHSIPAMPSAIPYKTSYFKKDWGFCVSDNQKKKIIKSYKDNDIFKIFINTNFKKNGHLNYGELYIKGKSKQEILISTYICHPSMANNELSGPIVSMGLIDYFARQKNEKSLRFLFVPETIGAIGFLSKNYLDIKNNIVGGYNLSCIGDNRMHSCIMSKYNNSPSDYALKEAYKALKIKYKEFTFLERGSDERQYNSPGIDLPISSIFRSKYGKYKEYHTSLDNFNFISYKGIRGGFNVALKAIKILNNKIVPKTFILGEPFLSKRKLDTIQVNKHQFLRRQILDFLQYSDGKNDLKKISSLIKIDMKTVRKIYIFLKLKKILKY